MLIAVFLTSYLTKSAIYNVLRQKSLHVMGFLWPQRPLNFRNIASVRQRFGPSCMKLTFSAIFFLESDTFMTINPDDRAFCQILVLTEQALLFHSNKPNPSSSRKASGGCHYDKTDNNNYSHE
jgi:hypothetical protein